MRIKKLRRCKLEKVVKLFMMARDTVKSTMIKSSLLSSIQDLANIRTHSQTRKIRTKRNSDKFTTENEPKISTIKFKQFIKYLIRFM